MANTYQLIEAKTLGTLASTVTFSSIPNTYTDLKLVYSARSDTNGAGTNRWRDVSIGFNGTGSNTNISNKVIYGLGSGTPGSISLTVSSGGGIPSADSTSPGFSNVEIYIPNYASANNKSYSVDFVTENNATTALAVFVAGLWTNSAAITSFTLYPDTGNFVQYSSFYLYGIKNS